jgi:AbrB family looped-hinge helix DNA binding protein
MQSLEPIALSFTTALDKRGRLVIRKAARESMGLHNGGRVDWLLDNDGVRLRKA